MYQHCATLHKKFSPKSHKGKGKRGKKALACLYFSKQITILLGHYDQDAGTLVWEIVTHGGGGGGGGGC